MKRQQFVTAFILLAVALFGTSASRAEPDYKVVTIVSAESLHEAKQAAPVDRVSDQALRHVKSAEGNLGIGVVHRPHVEAGGPIMAIRHHKQSEVYRVMSGMGTLVTSASMSESNPLDPEGYIVTNLTGPSDVGVIDKIENNQLIGEGDVVIIPAGVAHGFSEITEAITYMVVRIDPQELVELK